VPLVALIVAAASMAAIAVLRTKSTLDGVLQRRGIGAARFAMAGVVTMPARIGEPLIMMDPPICAGSVVDGNVGPAVVDGRDLKVNVAHEPTAAKVH
jgi:hypothetical protein